MTGSTARRSALFLSLLMLVGGPLGTFMISNDFNEDSSFLEPATTPLYAGAGDDAVVQLSGNSVYDEAFTVDVPSESPVTDIHLSMKPSVDQTQHGFEWTDASIWSHSSSVLNGTFVENNVLTGNGAGTLWDFNSNAAGWTFSNSYSGRVTTPACGYNGSSGGSIRTHAGSTYATSPITDFSGVSAMPFHAWVHEGRSGCGETPDSGENLQFQYRTSSNTWTTFKTFTAAGFSGTPQTNFQYMTMLPPAALHTNSQIRIHQTSGSSTCCDFWFVDDVHYATPPSAEWTSPSIGFSSSSFQVVESGPWAPLYLDASIPEGANLSWTVIDTSTGNPIPGMTGTDMGLIPLNGVDWKSVTSVKLHLYFEPSANGEMPQVYSISGDGSYYSSFSEEPYDRGWTMSGGATHSTFNKSVLGVWNDTLESPWYSSTAALAEVYVDATTVMAQAQIRTSESLSWNNISLPYSLSLLGDEGTAGSHQLRFTSASNNSSDSWEVFDVTMGVYGGILPAAPAIDFYKDGVFEWGGSDARVGSWGWQDRFENGLTYISANPGISGSSSAKAWIPATEPTSFGFSALSSSGNLSSVNLNHDGQTIANWYVEGGSSHFTLNQTQLADLNASVSSTTSLVSGLGTYFTEVEIEVFGTGLVTLAGLGVPYEAQSTLMATSDSPFVLGLNGIRNGLSSVGGVHSIPLPLTSDTAGGLHVAIEGLNFSSSVELLNMNMHTDGPVLTPSQFWNTLETTFKVSSSSATSVRLDIVGGNHSASWTLPLNG